MNVFRTLATVILATLVAGGLLGVLLYDAGLYFWKWQMAACVAGAIITCVGYYKLTRDDFKKHAGKMLFILIACVMPATTFVRQVVTGTYPLGNDLAGGVELLYKLDYASLDRKIAEASAEVDALRT